MTDDLNPMDPVAEPTVEPEMPAEAAPAVEPEAPVAEPEVPAAE